MKALKSENAKKLLADPVGRSVLREFLVAKPFEPNGQARARAEEVKLQAGGKEYTFKVVPKPA